MPCLGPGSPLDSKLVSDSRIRNRQRRGHRYLGSASISPVSPNIPAITSIDGLSIILIAHTGCERDRAGNRCLHFDQFCMLELLFLFNPLVSSLRAMEQASELEKVQKRLGCGPASLGSLSE